MAEQHKPEEEPDQPESTPPQPPQNQPAPQPSGLGRQEADTRTWAMLTHLAGLAGFAIPLGNILGPFIVWQLKKNELPGLDEHGKAAVNFQITYFIAAVVSAILAIVVIGIFMLMAIGIFVLIEIILNAMRANNGEPPQYHLTMNFIK